MDTVTKEMNERKQQTTAYSLKLVPYKNQDQTPCADQAPHQAPIQGSDSSDGYNVRRNRCYLLMLSPPKTTFFFLTLIKKD